MSYDSNPIDLFIFLLDNMKNQPLDILFNFKKLCKNSVNTFLLILYNENKKDWDKIEMFIKRLKTKKYRIYRKVFFSVISL